MMSLDLPTATLAREWQALDGNVVPHGGGESGDSSFKLMSFNVLADGLAQGGGFVKVPAHQLEWTYRFGLLLRQVDEIDAVRHLLAPFPASGMVLFSCCFPGRRRLAAHQLHG